MKTKDQLQQLRSLTPGELTEELAASAREQFNLRMQHSTKQLGQTDRLKKVRRKIAQINTIIQEKTTG